MATNERVINRSADDGTLICRSAECLQEPSTDGGYLCSDPIFAYFIFTTYDLARGITDNKFVVVKASQISFGRET